MEIIKTLSICLIMLGLGLCLYSNFGFLSDNELREKERAEKGGEKLANLNQYYKIEKFISKLGPWMIVIGVIFLVFYFIFI